MPTRTRAWARPGSLATVLLAVFVDEQLRGWDDVQLLRERIDDDGGAAPSTAPDAEET